MNKLIITAVLLCSTASMIRSGNCCISRDAGSDQEICANATESLALLRDKALQNDADSRADLDNFSKNLADSSYIISCFSAGRLRSLGLINSDNKVHKAIREAFYKHSQYSNLEK